MANATGIFSGVQRLLSARQGWNGQARMHVLDQDILETVKHHLANNHMTQVVEQIPLCAVASVQQLTAFKL